MSTFTVTGIERRYRGKVRVLLDSGTPLTLSGPVAAEVGLREGQELSAADIESLRSADRLHLSLNAALRFLGPRPRSEAEIRARLNRRGFDAETVERTLGRLRERGLVDDAAFARFWRENRESFRPRSSRLMGLELRRLGVDAGTVAEATAGVDDERGAYRAAQRKARLLAGLDYPAFRKRLGGFLRRCGFDYEVVNRTVDLVWQEQTRPQPDT
jgi:regulatory protein